MPTYEYRCAKGHAFDVFQKMSDPAVASCPECGEAAERVLSGGAGFLFKGEGFYITDYRSADYKRKAEAEKGASGSPDAAPDKGKTAAKGAGGKKTPGGSSAGASGSTASGGGGDSGDSGGSKGSGGSGKSSPGTDG